MQQKLDVKKQPTSYQHFVQVVLHLSGLKKTPQFGNPFYVWDKKDHRRFRLTMGFFSKTKKQTSKLIRFGRTLHIVGKSYEKRRLVLLVWFIKQVQKIFGRKNRIEHIFFGCPMKPKRMSSNKSWNTRLSTSTSGVSRCAVHHMVFYHGAAGNVRGQMILGVFCNNLGVAKWFFYTMDGLVRGYDKPIYIFIYIHGKKGPSISQLLYHLVKLEWTPYQCSEMGVWLGKIWKDLTMKHKSWWKRSSSGDGSHQKTQPLTPFS